MVQESPAKLITHSLQFGKVTVMTSPVLLVIVIVPVEIFPESHCVKPSTLTLKLFPWLSVRSPSMLYPELLLPETLAFSKV